MRPTASSYNIITEEGRFASLVREIGHSIATEYSLTYRTPRPIEDGTDRSVELKVDYNSELATPNSYQVRGVGGAAINVPDGRRQHRRKRHRHRAQATIIQLVEWRCSADRDAGLFGLSRMRFGLSTDELKAIVEAQGAPSLRIRRQHPRRPLDGAAAPARSSPSQSPSPRPAAREIPGCAADSSITIDPVPAEYSLLKDEISVGRGEDNDVVIPHASVSRAHARLMSRNGGFELMDLNSTNGSYIDDRQIRGSAFLSSGTHLRLGDIRFVLQL